MGSATLSLIEQEEAVLIPAYAKLPLAIEKGSGMYVWDLEGNRYLDLYGGHAVALLGHSHPALTQALNSQASKLFFYSSVTYQTERAKSAHALVHFFGGGMKVFFSNSGSEANENALKIARLLTSRNKVISFYDSFHGRTYASLAVTGIEKYRRGVSSDSVSFAHLNDLEELEKLIDSDTAAVILEPIQSLAGVRMAKASFAQALEKKCRETGALLIVDEIQTGLGRCGTNFLSHRLGIRPDIVTLAKGLAGGFPIGATLVRDDHSAKIKVGDLGSTFGGGPLASVLATETIRILKSESYVANAESKGAEIRELMKRIPHKEVRGMGLLIGIELARSAAEVQLELLARGILVGTSLEPNTIRLLPPLTVSSENLKEFSSALKEIV